MMRGQRSQAPIHAAAGAGNWDAVAALGPNSAMLQLCDANGRSPFHVAIVEGHATVAEKLLALPRGNLVVDWSDVSLRTPLHDAAARGMAVVVSQLLKYGATEQPDEDAMTPTDEARAHGHHDVLKALVANAVHVERAHAPGAWACLLLGFPFLGVLCACLALFTRSPTLAVDDPIAMAE